MNHVPDEIRKQTVLDAPQDKVWAALSDAAKFGAWFGAAVEGPFVAGARVWASIQPTQVDAQVAKSQEPFAGMRFPLDVVTVDAPTTLAFRWTPGAAEVKPGDPTTLVTFTLRAVDDAHTELTIVESGFAQIPLDRRAQAFADNDGGWAAQLVLIAKFLARGA